MDMGNLFKRVTRGRSVAGAKRDESAAGNCSVLFRGRTFESFALLSN